jgi:hypothetical protein
LTEPRRKGHLFIYYDFVTQTGTCTYNSNVCPTSLEEVERLMAVMRSSLVSYRRNKQKGYSAVDSRVVAHNDDAKIKNERS